MNNKVRKTIVMNDNSNFSNRVVAYKVNRKRITRILVNRFFLRCKISSIYSFFLTVIPYYIKQCKQKSTDISLIKFDRFILLTLSIMYRIL